MVKFNEIKQTLIADGITTQGKLLNLELIGRIQGIREREGLSQIELSRRSNVPQKTISRMENRLSTPSLETLNRLLVAMGYSMNIEIEKKC